MNAATGTNDPVAGLVRALEEIAGTIQSARGRSLPITAQILDLANDALSDYRSAHQNDGWMPMGTYQTEAVKGPYAPHVFCGHSEKKWIRMGRYDLTLKRWYYSGTNERSQWAQVEGDAPTHWQHLPLPPVQP